MIHLIVVALLIATAVWSIAGLFAHIARAEEYERIQHWPQMIVWQFAHGPFVFLSSLGFWMFLVSQHYLHVCRHTPGVGSVISDLRTFRERTGAFCKTKFSKISSKINAWLFKE